MLSAFLDRQVEADCSLFLVHADTLKHWNNMLLLYLGFAFTVWVLFYLGMFCHGLMKVVIVRSIFWIWSIQKKKKRVSNQVLESFKKISN